MILPAATTLPTSRTGLGVVVNPNGTYYVPDYCSWLPFSSYTQSCKPPTEAEFLADQRASIGPAAKADPELMKQVEASWLKALELSCNSDPEQCAQYHYALEHPGASATWGMNPTVRTLGNVPWWVWAAGAGAIALLVIRR